MKTDDLTVKEILSLLADLRIASRDGTKHPMIGRRCLVRCYGAGVHIGDVAMIEGDEVYLKNALRLWKWQGGGLSLSAVASNGIKGGRLNKTGEVYLTSAIELIPTTPLAEKSFLKFIEDDK
jgi:hypothetical protein